MKMITSSVLGSLGLLISSLPSPAQDSISYTFDDWQVTCAQRENALPCDMHQSLIDSASGETIVRFSLAYSPDEETYAIQIRVPLGVRLEGGMVIRAGDTTVEGIQFSRCLPHGCLVEARLEEPLLSAMSAGGEAVIGIVDAIGQTAALPFSLKGFKEARAQLQSQTELYLAKAE
jgi:invasion protein IalB